MRVLVTGACGFVGSELAAGLLEHLEGLEIVGLDNLSRPGSPVNLPRLRRLGVRLVHGDVRAPEDLETLPAVDWVVDAAANPSVLAGVDGLASSRQVVAHNLGGTLNLLELCRRHGAGFLLVSTSRVYSIAALAGLPVTEHDGGFRLDVARARVAGVSADGISEAFPTTPPVSLYGASKLASEVMALEYGAAFGFPVWVDRCGVLAGAGQFGRADQGIFAFWLNSFLRNRPLTYIGFGGAGWQTRDAFHPRDLVPLLTAQMAAPLADPRPRVLNLGGGPDNAMSLAQLSAWCADRWGAREVASVAGTRTFDVPWVVMDSRRAADDWGWRVATPLATILEEIARHGEAHPDWLDISRPR